MAQLVKLQDYVSRYQIDLTRYPTQFVRMKRGQWEKVKNQWENGEITQTWEHIESFEEEHKSTIVNVIKKLIPKKRSTEEEALNIEAEDIHIEEEEEFLEEASTLEFEPTFLYQPTSIEELKKMFMDQFFYSQINWASSTIREKSYVDPKYFHDDLLKTFLQSLPDNLLIFYYPIIQVKKAPVELDIIILTPTECLLITAIEQENDAAFIGSSNRFWLKKVGKREKKLLNPLIQLNRMEVIIHSLFSVNKVDIPIRKILLSRNGYIDYPELIYNVQFVDKREYPTFFASLRRTPSPIKRMQIEAAKAILSSVQTTSYLRDIWNTDEENEN